MLTGHVVIDICEDRQVESQPHSVFFLDEGMVYPINSFRCQVPLELGGVCQTQQLLNKPFPNKMFKLSVTNKGM